MSKFLDEFGLAHVWANIKNYIDSKPSSGGDSVPAGSIIIWSGSSSAIPSGWTLCDGTNGTPDLRGRFVLGESENHVLGETGGEEEVTLTIEQMPKHRHNMTNMFTMTSFGTVASTDNYRIGKIGGSAPTTSYSGSSEPHPNMPPYYTLCYIMKL